jgi:hypothetical protein
LVPSVSTAPAIRYMCYISIGELAAPIDKTNQRKIA